MPLILGTNSIKDTGYDVANSLRFNSGSSDYLTRTFGTPTSAKTWTLSFWVKRSKLSDSQFYFNTDGGNEEDRIHFNSSDAFIWFEQNSSGGTVAHLETTRKFRDISAWSHIVVARDSTQSTASDRIKLYINGVQETALDANTYPSQNDDSRFNTAVAHEIGARNAGTFIDAYLAEIVLIDGQQLDATSFGEFDSDSSTVWKPKDVSGLTFGNNGFHLDFENASSLGADVSGNSNNFTVNNLTSVDQSTDTCTNNFATLNPLYKQDHAFSDGNLTHTSSSADWDSGVSTIAASSGKYYFEAKVTAIEPPTRTILGVGDVRDANEIAEDQFGLTNYNNGDTVAYYGSDGSVYKNGSSQSGSWSSFTTNDIIGMYVDLDNGKVYFHKNGTMQNSGDPTSGSTGTGAISITTGQTYVFGLTHYGGGAGQINFGSPPFSISSGNSDPNGYGNFEYDPQGYYALNTKNLAEFG